jgi:hypothetical protein
MKSPSLNSINEPTVAVLPPALSDRIRTRYAKKMRNGNISQKALEAFWRSFMDDEEFCGRIMSNCDQLAEVIFDPDEPSWGIWPVLDLEKCLGLSLVLGIIFEQCAERIIVDLPEEFVTRIEAKSRAESRGLCDLLLDELTERKEAAGLQKGGEA